MIKYRSCLAIIILSCLLLGGIVVIIPNDASATTINGTVMGNVAYGTIYDNKSMAIESNVWFTPYASDTNTTLSLGNDHWTQSGCAYIWGTSGTISAITGTPTYTTLSSGDTLSIQKLYDNGTVVNSVSLTSGTSPINSSTSASSSNGSTSSSGSQTIHYILIVVIIAVIVFVVIAVYYVRKRNGQNERDQKR